MNKKQRDILEKYFNIDDTEYDDGKYLELEDWTDGGVDMLIYIDLQQTNIINGLEEYLNNFDIDEEIDIYRQDKSYRDAFKITDSVKDFENWVKYIKNIIKELKEAK